MSSRLRLRSWFFFSSFFVLFCSFEIINNNKCAGLDEDILAQKCAQSRTMHTRSSHWWTVAVNICVAVRLRFCPYLFLSSILFSSLLLLLLLLLFSVFVFIVKCASETKQQQQQQSKQWLEREENKVRSDKTTEYGNMRKTVANILTYWLMAKTDRQLNFI